MERLQTTLSNHLKGITGQSCIVAFSGGVDSSLLLQVVCMVAAEADVEVHAVTFKTRLHPMQDIAVSEKIVSELGVPHHIIEIDELEQGGIMNNPLDRCYLCKKYLFTRLRELAEQLGVSVIMDGTNSDDLKSYRPGLKALKELGIISPLAEAGLTKNDVRAMAQELQLSVADRPSSPCLATRFPYNTALSYDCLRLVEEAEQFLHSLGLYNVRLRVHDNLARLEIDQDSFLLVVEQRDVIVATLKQLGYTFVTLDLEGFRSGSMDYHLQKQ